MVFDAGSYSEPLDLWNTVSYNLSRAAKNHHIKIGADFVEAWSMPATDHDDTEHDHDDTKHVCDKLFCNNKTSVLYLHGNGGHRGSPEHRLKLYKLLTDHGYNLVTLDYRGFADSHFDDDSRAPSVESVTEDAAGVYQWMLSGLSSSLMVSGGHTKIIVIGHSLGSAVAVHFLSHLSHDQPCALLLLAPLNNVQALVYILFISSTQIKPLKNRICLRAPSSMSLIIIGHLFVS